jgi:PIN domain nuclease of toxin-antitoxin system
VKLYVADTHAVVWFITGKRPKLGVRARRIFETTRTGAATIAVSVISLWEIAALCESDALRLPAGFSAWCDALEGTPGFRVEPLLRADIEEARALPSLRDPQDRLITGTALRLGVPLLTADERITASKRVPVIW